MVRDQNHGCRDAPDSQCRNQLQSIKPGQFLIYDHAGAIDEVGILEDAGPCGIGAYRKSFDFQGELQRGQHSLVGINDIDDGRCLS